MTLKCVYDCVPLGAYIIRCLLGYHHVSGRRAKPISDRLCEQCLLLCARPIEVRKAVKNWNNGSRNIREDTCGRLQIRTVRGARAKEDQIATKEHRKDNHFRFCNPNRGVHLIIVVHITMSSVIPLLPWKGELRVDSADVFSVEIVKQTYNLPQFRWAVIRGGVMKKRRRLKRIVRNECMQNTVIPSREQFV